MPKSTCVINDMTNHIDLSYTPLVSFITIPGNNAPHKFKGNQTRFPGESRCLGHIRSLHMYLHV